MPTIHFETEDITNINRKHKNQGLNNALQNYMFTMVTDPSENVARESLRVLTELHRKRTWYSSISFTSLSLIFFILIVILKE